MKRALSLLAALLLITTAYSQGSSCVEVRGQAEKLVAPDRFELWIEIDESTTKGKATIDEVEKGMVKALKSLGVDCEESLSMRYASSDYIKRKGTTSKRIYILKLNEGELVHKVYDKLGELEITLVRLSKSYNSQQDKYEEEVRNEALLNARATAQSMAAVYGQSIGACTYMKYSIQYSGQNMTFAEDAVMVGYASNRKDVEAHSPISFDKKSIKAYVDTKFVLMPSH